MKRKLGLGIVYSSGIEPSKQLEIFKKVGFDAFFTDFTYGDVGEMRRLGEKYGLEYQSVHAPFYKMHAMWEQSNETEAAKAELIGCVRACAENDVRIAVMHPFIGFDKNSPTPFGISNFREIVDYAREAGVNVAFENVEGDKYLSALMEEFRHYENVGFCWDTGHEMCYNRGEDMLSLYGGRIICTHINDNVGVRGENISCKDDLHLLPFDGVKDWTDAMARLKKTGFDGVLTSELKIDSEIDKEFGTGYADMAFEDYVGEVYKRARRLAELMNM